MSMTPRLRKFVLTVHVTVSVGWLGAVASFLALAIAGLATSHDPRLVQAAYLVMEFLGWVVLVPCSLATPLTGLVLSLGTEWGLFRHYWILAKFLLNVAATALLLLHMESVTRMSTVAAAEETLTQSDHRTLRLQLVADAGLALLALVAATGLSVYKPWGRIRSGRRKRVVADAAAPPPAHGGEGIALPAVALMRHGSDAYGGRVDRDLPVRPRRGLYLLLGIVGVVAFFVVLHLAGGGRRH